MSFYQRIIQINLWACSYICLIGRVWPQLIHIEISWFIDFLSMYCMDQALKLFLWFSQLQPCACYYIPPSPPLFLFFVCLSMCYMDQVLRLLFWFVHRLLQCLVDINILFFLSFLVIHLFLLAETCIPCLNMLFNMIHPDHVWQELWAWSR